MSDAIEHFRATLLADGVLRSAGAVLTPLAGGVSSEIYRVVDGQRTFVVKRALAKLKVEQEWFADTSRNRHEWAFIRYVSQFEPGAVPRLLSTDAGQGYFCMEYLDGFANWKADLLAGRLDVPLAHQAGAVIGRIHAHSRDDATARDAFDTLENFDQLRIDPYLRAAAEKHPEVAQTIREEARRLAAARQCLVHGDYSPKNLLHSEGRLVVLDCEVAWYGDPCFDLAFLLNHLFLKSLYHAPREAVLQPLIDAAIAGYRAANPHAAEVESRAERLLPMLMLARIDGKSPVEYLTSPQQRELVREFSIQQLRRGGGCSLRGLQDRWFERLSEHST